MRRFKLASAIICKFECEGLRNSGSPIGKPPSQDDRPSRRVMSKKQSRESLEAELNTSEIERVRTRLRETLHDIEEFRNRLQDEE